MEFIKVALDNLQTYHSSIDDFFERNFKDNKFFHPHEFCYSGIHEELFEKQKDYFVFLMDANTIASYGMLRGWTEGYEIPSLGIITDINYRGKGVSTQMMNHLEYIAKTKGANKIRLTVYKKNKIAISLYNKLGYIFSDKNKKELLGIKNL